MPPRHARHEPVNATVNATAAGRVVVAHQTQRTRRGNAGLSLQVGQPHPSRQAMRKGVTVVPQCRPGSPVRPSNPADVSPVVAA